MKGNNRWRKSRWPQHPSLASQFERWPPPFHHPCCFVILKRVQNTSHVFKIPFFIPWPRQRFAPVWAIWWEMSSAASQQWHSTVGGSWSLWKRLLGGDLYAYESPLDLWSNTFPLPWTLPRSGCDYPVESAGNRRCKCLKKPAQRMTGWSTTQGESLWWIVITDGGRDGWSPMDFARNRNIGGGTAGCIYKQGLQEILLVFFIKHPGLSIQATCNHMVIYDLQRSAMR